MPLCGSRLQGQRLEEEDCHYVCSMVSAIQSPLQQGAQPLLYGGHYSGAFLQKTCINGAASIELLLFFWRFLTGSFFCCFSLCRVSVGSSFFQLVDLLQMRERQHAVRGLSPPPIYTDSITAAPEVPAIRGSGDETQAEISIRQWGLETGPYSWMSFYNLSDRDEPLRCILIPQHQSCYQLI